MEDRDVDVCVVGAGFAGLAAARRLVEKHKTVAVLEARERVGGRAWNKTLKDGTVISVGGTWLGKGHDRMKAFAEAAKLSTYPQYGLDDPNDPLGEHLPEMILRLDGVNKRYKGFFFPIGLGALASVALGVTELNGIAATVPTDRPWEARDAKALDSQTLGEWIASSWHVPSDTAKRLFQASMGLFFSSDLSLVSLLGSMVLARGGGDDLFLYYMDANNTETELVEGGAPAVATYLGTELGDALCTSAPVRRIKWAADRVEVFADGVTVRAKFVIITAPPVLASQIEYEPALPDAYGQLMRQMPAGIILRAVAVYDRPFWRDQGLSGQTLAPDSPVVASIDQCPKAPAGGGQPIGVLSSYSIGSNALQLSEMGPVARKALWLKELADRFDDPAALTPRDYNETDWSAEQWSQGAMIAHFPPGVLTTFGHVLHQPCGPIYWAGAERATLMHGLMEGAARSGEQAADDVMSKLG